MCCPWDHGKNFNEIWIELHHAEISSYWSIGHFLSDVPVLLAIDCSVCPWYGHKTPINSLCASHPGAKLPLATGGCFILWNYSNCKDWQDFSSLTCCDLVACCVTNPFHTIALGNGLLHDGTKPFLDAMLHYCQLDLSEVQVTSVKLENSSLFFYCCIWKSTHFI